MVRDIQKKIASLEALADACKEEMNHYKFLSEIILMIFVGIYVFLLTSSNLTIDTKSSLWFAIFLIFLFYFPLDKRYTKARTDYVNTLEKKFRLCSDEKLQFPCDIESSRFQRIKTWFRQTKTKRLILLFLTLCLGGSALYYSWIAAHCRVAVFP